MSINIDADELINRLMIKEITSTTPISRELESRLFKEYQTAQPNRKKAIRAVIVNANLRFALKSCLLYKNVPNVNISDMMSEAKIGLLTAFDSYDPESGIKFISYAVWQIRHRFSKYFDGIDLIRIPTHQKTKLNKNRKLIPPEDFDDITAYFNTITQKAVPIDLTFSDDDNECKLSDILVDESAYNPEDGVCRKIASKHISESIDSALTPEEATVIRTIYGLDCNQGGLNEASSIINKSHERVRQLRDKALAKLANERKIKDSKKILNLCSESSRL